MNEKFYEGFEKTAGIVQSIKNFTGIGQRQAAKKIMPRVGTGAKGRDMTFADVKNDRLRAQGAHSIDPFRAKGMKDQTRENFSKIREANKLRSEGNKRLALTTTGAGLLGAGAYMGFKDSRNPDNQMQY